MLWLSSQQALGVFKVRIQTLYANVSRGRIRTRVDPRDPRRRQYHGDDVRRMAGRHAGRRSAGTVAADAIAYGDPILPSAISTIAAERLWYRGQDAMQLSNCATLEQIADILWQTQQARFVDARVTPRSTQHSSTPLTAALLALAARAASDPPSRSRARSVLIIEAQSLLGEITVAMLGRRSSKSAALHLQMAAAWHRPRAADILRRALVLLADHELNASTFATRVAVSTGTSLSASLMAGLATLAGPLHGGAAIAANALMTLARREGSAAAVRHYLAQGQPVPAFGHPLYANGDPRAAALLRQFKAHEQFVAVRTEVEALTGELPNIDFALCALADTFSLPLQSTFVIFALARSVGWIAHALEQVESGQLIRPRARYSGAPLPLIEPRRG